MIMIYYLGYEKTIWDFTVCNIIPLPLFWTVNIISIFI